MKKVFIDGNYVIVTDSDGNILFKSQREFTKFIDSGQSVKIYHDTKVQDYSYAGLDINNVQDEDGVKLDILDWLKDNVGEGTGGVSRINKEISEDTYTLLAEDKSKFLIFTSATDVTLSIPEGLDINVEYVGIQNGAGQVKPVGLDTVTVFAGSTKELNTLEKGSEFKLRQISENDYLFSGDLEDKLIIE